MPEDKRSASTPSNHRARARLAAAAVAVLGLALGYWALAPKPPLAPNSVEVTSTDPPLHAAPAQPAHAQPAHVHASTSPAATRAEPLPELDKFPRDPDEWQGMLVPTYERQLCERAEECGLALACRADKLCGPCQADRDCVGGEVCALDHCIKRANLTCRSRRDCGKADRLCVLTGLSDDPRGNGEMRSECLGTTGGRDFGPTPEARYEPAGEPAVAPSELLESLDDTNAARGGNAR